VTERTGSEAFQSPSGSSIAGSEPASGIDSPDGQLAIEDHLAGWFDHIDTDFRATSLNRLVLDLVRGGQVLDIGCGSGALSAQLLSAGHEVISQDPSERMLALCRAHLRRRQLDDSGVRCGTIDSIPERRVFDSVVALDVIEHIEDDIGALASLRDSLRPYGRLVVSVPALSRLYGPKDLEVGHYRRYDRSVLLDALRRAGFEPLTCRSWNLIGVVPVWLSVRRGKRLSEEFRYSDSARSRAVNACLRWWFRWFEEPVRAPVGLTLLASARPR
jgi:SAM-dependent methyltransferase